jgi:NodT family efflux transporter outer membrane factor (OMF) lipoprotein
MGPDFHAPEAPKVKRFTPQAQSAAIQYNQDIPASWWTVFHSRSLNNLIKRGLAHNPTIEMGQSSLKSAQANLLATIGPSLFPTISGQLGGNHERTSLLATGINVTPTEGVPAVAIVNPFNLYNSSVGVTYNLDVFGGTRRHLESLNAEIEHQYFELEATYLALTTNIVTSFINIASLKAQIKITEKMIACRQKALNIVNNNYKSGHDSRMAFLERETGLNKALSSLPPLKDALAKKNNALAVLVGTLPSEAQLPSITLEDLHNPTQLPVTLPSLLVQQRPDIRSAESQLHKVSAEIGVATANIFPKLILGANYGWNGTSIAQLFSPANVIWNYGGQAAQTLFQGGALIAKRKVALADFEYTSALYRKTVLESFQNVADVLRSLELDTELLRIQSAAEANAKNQYSLMKRQHQLGRTRPITLLSSQEQYLQAHMKVIQAEEKYLSDTAALFQSLGGGWWNRKGQKS